MTRASWDNVDVSKWAIAGAWVLVAALATTLTWQIVSAADAQVSDQPPIQVAPAPSTLGLDHVSGAKFFIEQQQ